MGFGIWLLWALIMFQSICFYFVIRETNHKIKILKDSIEILEKRTDALSEVVYSDQGLENT